MTPEKSSNHVTSLSPSSPSVLPFYHSQTSSTSYSPFLSPSSPFLYPSSIHHSLHSSPENSRTNSRTLFHTPINCSRRSNHYNQLISDQGKLVSDQGKLISDQELMVNNFISNQRRRHCKRGKIMMKETLPIKTLTQLSSSSINHSSVINTNNEQKITSNSIISDPSLITASIISNQQTPTVVGTPMLKTLSNETNSNDPSDKKSRIFIGNLNTNLITKRSLALLFSTYGTIKAISLHKGKL